MNGCDQHMGAGVKSSVMICIEVYEISKDKGYYKSIFLSENQFQLRGGGVFILTDIAEYGYE